MDLSMLNNAVLGTWGERLQVAVGNITHNITGVYVDAYEKSPVGNTEVERPDPSFSFERSDFDPLKTSVGDLITYAGINYSIISDPTYESGDWCNVSVRQY